MELQNKKILVTGGSSGIGQAIAYACAKKGAVVCINYLKNERNAADTLTEINTYSQGYSFQADLTKETEVRGMFETIAQQVGAIDVLVNNAGTSRHGTFFDGDRWREQFDTIFFSALYASQCFLKQNESSELRKILNVSSYYGNPGCGPTDYYAYSAAKAAMQSMTTTLAKERAAVLVNAIAPGYTDTALWRGTPSAIKKEYAERTVIKRFISPDEVAHMAVAIIENDAMTGQVVTIDGGLSIATQG